MAGMAWGRGESPVTEALPFLVPALALLAALLLGCATPAPIYRLDPRAGDVIWVAGRASLQQELGGIRVAAAFEQQHGDMFGVRIEIQNGTEERLEVGPRTISYSACSAISVSSCTASRKVINPEKVLASIDEKQSMDRAAAANSQAVLGTLVLLSAVGDVATIASGHADRVFS